MAIFCAFVERRDAAIKRSLQKNITRPMPTFLSFPNELQSNVDEEKGDAEAGETNLVPTHLVTEGQEA
ncbi:hypothetical protein J1N35_005478 [Gossypium stocksii]|uniref:Uncharacterized protein n=1 Tax=Gossypium stocksii TaxID=47602 RepID=A0A9D3WFC1_9ROSI|nr:hypothetical protein J1N35_005478 [Gossypium stocksii]